MSKLDALLARLEGVRATGPGRWAARCPAHPDRSPSLTIRATDDDKTLLHCFAGCPTDDILAAIGMEWQDLYPDHDVRPYAQAIAAGQRRHHKSLADIALSDYARHVLLIAAADQGQGRTHDLWDRATIALAAEIMQGGQSHG